MLQTLLIPSLLAAGSAEEMLGQRLTLRDTTFGSSLASGDTFIPRLILLAFLGVVAFSAVWIFRPVPGRPYVHHDLTKYPILALMVVLVFAFANFLLAATPYEFWLGAVNPLLLGFIVSSFLLGGLLERAGRLQHLVIGTVIAILGWLLPQQDWFPTPLKSYYPWTSIIGVVIAALFLIIEMRARSTRGSEATGLPG